jgi:hypothetical protein
MRRIDQTQVPLLYSAALGLLAALAILVAV